MKFSKKLAEKYNISVRSAKEYIHEGAVFLDGARVKKDSEASEGELTLNKNLTENIPDPADYLIAAYDDVVFFDKPVFMHSERHRLDDPVTMQDIVSKFFPDYSLISRLDYSTDGVMAAVRNGYTPKNIKKIYLAVVDGVFEKSVTCDLLIDSSHRKHVRIIGDHGGNLTIFSPVAVRGTLSLVRAEIVTASRHQIRATLAHLGYPISGDTAYGGQEAERIMLHCAETYIDNYKCVSKLMDKFCLFFNTDR
ncbi:MAG: pseudouridine synthase [Deferribacterales bacterium]